MHFWTETLEEFFFLFFSYIWKDRNKMTIILGIGDFLLIFKTLYFGSIYNTWTSKKGLSIVFGYLLKSSFGGEGWIVSVDDLEYIIGGTYDWVRFVFYLFLSLLFVALSGLITSLIITSPLVQKLL
ncbi:hypothetical protein HN51_019213, partial [Arachis hypogaea]